MAPRGYAGCHIAAVRCPRGRRSAHAMTTPAQRPGATSNQTMLPIPKPEPIRCGWARTSLSIAYHDEEWGVPLHDDRRLFEFLILEGAQAGLSWETILQKRQH